MKDCGVQVIRVAGTLVRKSAQRVGAAVNLSAANAAVRQSHGIDKWIMAATLRPIDLRLTPEFRQEYDQHFVEAIVVGQIFEQHRRRTVECGWHGVFFKRLKLSLCVSQWSPTLPFKSPAAQHTVTMGTPISVNRRASKMLWPQMCWPNASRIRSGSLSKSNDRCTSGLISRFVASCRK